MIASEAALRASCVRPGPMRAVTATKAWLGSPSAVILTEIMDKTIRRCRGPAGVVNLVHGFGESAGKALTKHPAIKAIAFVSETTTGAHIMRQGAATLKRVHFELGGKNPVIIFDDSDLDRALDPATEIGPLIHPRHAD